MAAAELLEELKSKRLDLTGYITKLSVDLKDFQRNTNEGLEKNWKRHVQSRWNRRLEDQAKLKQQQLEANVDNILKRNLVVSTNIEEVEALRRNNDELKENIGTSRTIFQGF